MIKIVIDSTAYITREFCDKHDIAMAPQNTFLDGEHEVEGFPGSFEPFFNKLMSTSSFPKTSQPTPEKFMEAFEKIMQDKNNEIICITSTTGISGTYNSACVARSSFPEEVQARISIIDSLCAVQLIWFLVDIMLKMIENGEPRDKIVEHIEREKLLGRAYLTVHNLEYLKRGGRVKGASAFVGALLNIKPIIQLNDGYLSSYSKKIGHKKAIEFMVESMPNEAYNIGTAYVYKVDENVEYLNELLEKRYSGQKIRKNLEIGQVVGSHLGPLGFGVMFFDPTKTTNQPQDK